MSAITPVNNLMHISARGVHALAPVFDLFIRLWAAFIFFNSGLTKIASWNTTIMLFTDEYSVPFFSPQTAAVMATGGELILPVAVF